ncbi:MAG: hypothetical protein AB2795_02355 [Candidatus Thiodiazotropha endolucinida]
MPVKEQKYKMGEHINITTVQLNEWAETTLRMNHLGTLVQREIEKGNLERASDLSERARKRAWKLLNQLFESGATKPEGYCEPDAKA